MKVIARRLLISTAVVAFCIWVTFPILEMILSKGGENSAELEDSVLSIFLRILDSPENSLNVFYLVVFIFIEVTEFFLKPFWGLFIPDITEAIEGITEFFLSNIFPSIPNIFLGIILILLGSVSIELFAILCIARFFAGFFMASLTGSP